MLLREAWTFLGWLPLPRRILRAERCLDRVTLVVQVGLPSSSEQYIHRLGRTARAGRSGKGVIILTPPESGFLGTPDMRALPIQPHPELKLPSLPRSEIDKTLQIQAYSAWLGFNAQYTRQIFRSRQKFVDEANKYARDVLGWADESETPPLSPQTTRNLGIHGLNGVNTGSYTFERHGDQRYSARSQSPSHRSSWRGEGSRFDHALGNARRSPRYDTHKSSWRGEDGVSDDGFSKNRSRRDSDERSSYQRSDFGSRRSPRWSGGRVRREQGWGNEP